jgi:hypothetical protein
MVSCPHCFLHPDRAAVVIRGATNSNRGPTGLLIVAAKLSRLARARASLVPNRSTTVGSRIDIGSSSWLGSRAFGAGRARFDRPRYPPGTRNDFLVPGCAPLTKRKTPPERRFSSSGGGIRTPVMKKAPEIRGFLLGRGKPENASLVDICPDSGETYVPTHHTRWRGGFRTYDLSRRRFCTRAADAPRRSWTMPMPNSKQVSNGCGALRRSVSRQ